MYNASCFESRILNASDLEPICHNSGNFESEILVRVAFRKKSYNATDFEVQLICTKTDFDECFLSESEKVSPLDLFSPWKRQLLQLCVFSKTTNWWKEWKKKQFPFKTFEKNQILKQIFYNASDFESRNSKYVRILVKSTQLVIFWIGNFTACQILKHPFLPHVRFWTEILTTQYIITWNSFWKIKNTWTNRFKKFNNFWSIYTVKT